MDFSHKERGLQSLHMNCNKRNTKAKKRDKMVIQIHFSKAFTPSQSQDQLFKEFILHLKKQLITDYIQMGQGPL